MKKNSVSEKNEEKIIDLRTRRAKRKKNSKWKILILLATVAVLSVMLSPFFNVKWFDVYGNNTVPPAQIKSATGVAVGQNMFKINIKKSKNLIKKIPYIDEVNIYRKLPDGIRIKVTEREKFAYIKLSSGDLVIDKTGRVLELAGKDYDFSGLVEVKGFNPGKLKAGDFVGKNYEENVKMAYELWDKLREMEIEDRVSSINVKNVNYISMIFDNDKNIIVGDTYRLDYKLAMLQSAIASLSPSDVGTLDLRVEGEALFTPKE